jgi:cytochrome c5
MGPGANRLEGDPRVKMQARRLLQVSGIASALLVASVTVYALSPAAEQAIAERIKPVGEVCIEGDAACASAAVAGGAPKAPEEIYNTTCMGCHSTGAGGAPKMGDKGAWAARIKQGNDTLYKHAIEGLNAMPPKGLCMTCSDEEVIATVDYIVNGSK